MQTYEEKKNDKTIFKMIQTLKRSVKVNRGNKCKKLE